MKYFLLIYLLVIGINSVATEIPAGEISGTWNLVNSPYIINGFVTVPAGETLTIDAGVSVLFSGHYKFIVKGRLLANGTETDSVYFDSTAPEVKWWGIRYLNNQSAADFSSHITHAVIQNGYSSGGEGEENAGGILGFDYLYVENSSIRNCSSSKDAGATMGGNYNNCIIRDNFAVRNGGGAYGGVYTNCLIRNNAANSGGGTYKGTYDTCVISHNSAAYGGGSFLGDYTDCQITANVSKWVGGGTRGGYYVNCEISHNSSEDDAGGAANGNYIGCQIFDNHAHNGNGGGVHSGTYTRCDIYANTAGRDGGGCYNGVFSESTITNNRAEQEGGGAYDSKLTNCLISENESNKGGGVASFGNYLNCTITNNTAIHGGAGYMGVFTNCIITNNVADYAGACYGGSIINCTVLNNSAEIAGGAFYSTYTVKIINSIVWGNTADGLANAVAIIEPSNYEEIKNSCIEGGDDGIIGRENLDVNVANFADYPMFVEGDQEHAYRIQGNSPCVDAGTGSISISNWRMPTEDFSGEVRLYGTAYDVGAYEWNVTGSDDATAMAKQTNIMSNYPNPFNPSTTISYEMPSAGDVHLAIYNMRGQHVTTLFDGPAPAGRNQKTWNGRDKSGKEVGSGIYFARVLSNRYTSTKKMILLK